MVKSYRPFLHRRSTSLAKRRVVTSVIQGRVFLGKKGSAPIPSGRFSFGLVDLGIGAWCLAASSSHDEGSTRSRNGYDGQDQGDDPKSSTAAFTGGAGGAGGAGVSLGAGRPGRPGGAT